MKKVKNPDPVVPNPELETQAKALADATRTAIVKAEDVRIESIKHPQGNRLAARARTGKFVSRTEASAMVTAKETQNFLTEVDPETGLSRHKSLLNKLYDGAKTAAGEPRALGNAVKAVELIDEIAGHRAAREEALSNKDHVKNPINIVVIPSVTLVNPDVIDYEAELRKRKERDEKGPSFIDAEFKTNPPQEQK